ncbi:hypothetical protein C8Q80DRAFT_859673 [Daedaleopsis nitida]|nr:hypothetical protein C8Q80DRAFT_859673 [Daedaleopsis nitida]
MFSPFCIPEGADCHSCHRSGKFLSVLHIPHPDSPSASSPIDIQTLPQRTFPALISPLSAHMLLQSAPPGIPIRHLFTQGLGSIHRVGRTSSKARSHRDLPATYMREPPPWDPPAPCGARQCTTRTHLPRTAQVHNPAAVHSNSCAVSTANHCAVQKRFTACPTHPAPPSARRRTIPVRAIARLEFLFQMYSTPSQGAPARSACSRPGTYVVPYTRTAEGVAVASSSTAL